MSGINSGMMSSNRDDWETPRDLFERCDSIWHFDLDAASNDKNALCERHFTKEQDALEQSWGGAFSVHEPTIRKEHRCLREEGCIGVEKAEHRGHWPAASKDGYQMVVGMGGSICGGDKLSARSRAVLRGWGPATECALPLGSRSMGR